MAKTLNELANELKEWLLEIHSDNREKKTFRPEKYNNLKFSMDVVKEKFPYLQINIGMSEAKYNLNTLEKFDGSLGQEERYVQRWFNKNGIIPELQGCWNRRIANRGKITDVE